MEMKHKQIFKLAAFVIQIFLTTNAYSLNSAIPQACDCVYSLAMIRDFTVERLKEMFSNLPLLNQPKTDKIVYTLDEFIALPMGLDANSECISGKYAQYIFAINKELPDNDPKKYEVFISGLYSGDQVGIDNYNYIEKVLKKICYTPIHRGRISQAEWHKLVGKINDKSTSVIRFTNFSTFLSRYKTIKYGDVLDVSDNSFSDYLAKLSVSLQNTTTELAASMNSFYGPNFPASGYTSSSGLLENFKLKSMGTKYWNDDYLDPLIDAKNYMQNINQRNEKKAIYEKNQFKNDNKIIEGIHLYALDCMGNLFIYKTESKSSIIPLKRHSEFLGGAAVVSAGVMKFINGEITYIDNESGHYKPNYSTNLPNAINFLKNQYGVFTDESKTVKIETPTKGIGKLFSCNIIEAEMQYDNRILEFINLNGIKSKIFPTLSMSYRNKKSLVDGLEITIIYELINNRKCKAIYKYDQNSNLFVLMKCLDENDIDIGKIYSIEGLFRISFIVNSNQPIESIFELRYGTCESQISQPPNSSRMGIDSLVVYPTPTTDKIYIKNILDIDLESIKDVQIFDIMGQDFGKFKLNCTNEECNVSILSLSRGMYVLKIGEMSNTRYKKIYKE